MNDPLPLENTERRKTREPEIRVWDRLVRIGHWLLVLSFIVLYVRYRKFPLHTYAGYMVLLLIIIRVVWGFIGSRAARFRTFLYAPREMWNYLRLAFKGHAPYYFSHNPMGAAMVFFLLSAVFINSILGLILYSSGQQLGPFGALFPDTWEDSLSVVHEWIGHIVALAVIMHVLGVIWAAWLHRENYVMAMLTGYRRMPRSAAALLTEDEKKSRVPEFIRSRSTYIWLNYKFPVLGSMLLAGCILFAFVQIMEYLVVLNKNWLAY
jgi:cytochrome b